MKRFIKRKLVYPTDLNLQIFQRFQSINREMAINTTKSLAKIYRKLKMIGEFLPVIHLFLSPTIYDDGEEMLENPKVNKILLKHGMS